MSKHIHSYTYVSPYHTYIARCSLKRNEIYKQYTNGVVLHTHMYRY